MTNVKELSAKTNIEYDDNLMNIRLRQLRAFLAVVDTGSVSQAAVMIALTQSSVSKLISGLEDEIGFMLFDRLGRRFRLTEQGRMFLVQARDAIESFNDIRRLAMDIRDNQGKRLRVCAIGPLSFGQLMPRGLADFARSQPNFSISFETMFRIEIEDWVAQGHSDVGFTLLPAGNTSVSAKPFAKVNAVAIVPNEHPLAAHKAVAPADLEGHTIIMPHATARVRVMVEADFLGTGQRLKPNIETSNALSAAHLVANGAGVAVLDPFSLGSVPTGSFTVLKWKPDTKLVYGMIWQKGRSLKPHEEQLFKMIEMRAAEVTGAAR